MFEELMRVGGVRFLVPCVLAVLLVTLAKGLFGVHQSRRAARKDFLDLWSQRDAHDELWQQTAIRHLFGEWLPVPVIRLLLESSQSGRALLEVSSAWDLLEIDDETHAVNWKASKHRNAFRRRREIWFFTAIYWILGVLAALSSFYALAFSGGDLASIVRWVLIFELAFFAFASLVRSESLKDAQEAALRWFGLH